MAAMVDHRNSQCREHIITIEDPIEFFHRHKQCLVDQREVGVDTESYEVALKNTLRQAPNVILIGEVRDRETMQRHQFRRDRPSVLDHPARQQHRSGVRSHHQFFPGGKAGAGLDGSVLQRQGVHLATPAAARGPASA
jgi:hypothetical protein